MAILEGKQVITRPREVLEVKNALAAYDRFDTWRPEVEKDMLEAHNVLMSGLMTRRDPHPLIASSVFHYEFEFIHPFADGNGRMGRLWQTLILSRWNPLFADIPVESLVYEHQVEYYKALRKSTQRTDSAPFIAFMLRMILNAVTTAVTPQVSPQVGELLSVLYEEMSREELQETLGLTDRKSFRARYLKPALDEGLIEMTIPDKPNSRLQKYRHTEKGRLWLAAHRKR